MKVDVRYGLARRFAILKMEWMSLEWLNHGRGYLTRHGKGVCAVSLFNHTADVLDGAHEGRQLRRRKVCQSWDDTRRYDKNVLGR